MSSPITSWNPLVNHLFALTLVFVFQTITTNKIKKTESRMIPRDDSVIVSMMDFTDAKSSSKRSFCRRSSSQDLIPSPTLRQGLLGMHRVRRGSSPGDGKI